MKHFGIEGVGFSQTVDKMLGGWRERAAGSAAGGPRIELFRKTQ